MTEKTISYEVLTTNSIRTLNIILQHHYEQNAEQHNAKANIPEGEEIKTLYHYTLNDGNFVGLLSDEQLLSYSENGMTKGFITRTSLTHLLDAEQWPAGRDIADMYDATSEKFEPLIKLPNSPFSIKDFLDAIPVIKQQLVDDLNAQITALQSTVDDPDKRTRDEVGKALRDVYESTPGMGRSPFKSIEDRVAELRTAIQEIEDLHVSTFQFHMDAAIDFERSHASRTIVDSHLFLLAAQQSCEHGLIADAALCSAINDYLSHSNGGIE